MGISLSQGPFQYNRFDDYEARLGLNEKSSYEKKQDEEESDYEDEESEKGASNPFKMAKDVKDEGKKSKKSSDKDEEESKEDDEETVKDDAEEKDEPKAKRKKNKKDLEEANMAGAPSIKDAKPATKTNVKFDKHMGILAPTIKTVEGVESENMARRAMNKAPNSTKEKAQAKIMENTHQMDSYVRALGRMGATYDIHEKEEVAQEQLEESALGMGLVTPVLAGKSPDQQEAPEEVAITKDVVVDFLVSENYANNAVSAEAMFQHMSDEFLLVIENLISESAE